jgi:hypothetical protein
MAYNFAVGPVSNFAPPAKNGKIALLKNRSLVSPFDFVLKIRLACS